MRNLPLRSFALVLVLAASVARAQFGGGPVAVRTEAVEKRDVQLSQALVATIEPVTQTTLAAEQPGLVIERTFDEGSVLAKDATLVRMDTELLKIQRDAARAAAEALAAEVEQEKFRADNALRESNRLKGLFESNVIPEKEFLDQLTIAKTAAAGVKARAAEQAEKQAEVTRLDLMIKKSDVRVTLGNGVVARRYVEVGQWVKQGDPVADIVWTDPVFVRTNVPENLVARLKKGDEVRFSLDAVAGRAFVGKIDQILPVGDPASRTFPVKVLVPNPEGLLRPGFFARATMLSAGGAGQFLVPKDAIVAGPQGQHVIVARDGKAVLVTVKLRPRRGAKATVVGDLRETDRVVVRGNEGLRGGEAPMDPAAGPPPGPPPAGG